MGSIRSRRSLNRADDSMTMIIMPLYRRIVGPYTGLIYLLALMVVALVVVESHRGYDPSHHPGYIVDLDPTHPLRCKRHIEKLARFLSQHAMSTLQPRLLGGMSHTYYGTFPKNVVEWIKHQPEVISVEKDKIVRLHPCTNRKLSHRENQPFDTNPRNNTHHQQQLLRKLRDAYVQTPSPWNLEILSSSPECFINHSRKGTYIYPSSSGKGVRIYVVDTGIDITHPEFQGRAEWGTTILPTPNSVIPDIDEHGHGTHVAGTIGSLTYGVAKKANIVAVKIFQDETGPIRLLYEGLLWAVNNATHYVDKALFKRAEKLGITIVTAAGNGKRDACQISSAENTAVITVGAFCSDLKMAEFSNSGPCVDVLAPGCAIPSLSPFGHDEIVFKNGTSMAAPHVTGVVALIMSSSQRKMNVSELKEAVKRLASNQLREGANETSQLFLNIRGLIR